MGLSYQEVVIALMGKHYDEVRELGRFAYRLGLVSSVGLALIALTPLAGIWFETVSGLTPDLAHFALVPTIILIPIPFLSVILSFQRGILVVAHETRHITWATAIEVIGIAIGFPILGWKLGLVGVTAATLAFLAGRSAGNVYLWRPSMRVVQRRPHGASPKSDIGG
jgi:hypothetical protein